MTEAERAKEHEDHGPFKISIDRDHFTIHRDEMTGRELRKVPDPAIGADRDLFEVLPDHLDRKIEDDYTVEIYEGKRFFTAPAHINPGAGGK